MKERKKIKKRRDVIPSLGGHRGNIRRYNTLAVLWRRGLLWGAGSAGKPHDLLHGHADVLGEGGDLTLEVYHEGIWAPPTNYLDGAVRLSGLVQCHGAARAQGVRDNFVWVEPQSRIIKSSQPRAKGEPPSGSWWLISPHPPCSQNKHTWSYSNPRHFCAGARNAGRMPPRCSPRADWCSPWKLTIPGQNFSVCPGTKSPPMHWGSIRQGDRS